jgi:predicted kinase
VLIGGPPATGKTALATALAPHLGAAVLDLDVATGPLVRVVSGLAGVHDLDDPVLARLTRDARYETLLGLAEANMRAGRPVVLVAPWPCHRWQKVAGCRRLAATLGRPWAASPGKSSSPR